MEEAEQSIPRTWEEMQRSIEKRTGEKALTREDVLRLVKEHGTPQGLDLSGRNLSGVNLSNLELLGIILTSAHLQGADLRYAQLQQANLHRAYPWGADLRGADLTAANLQEAFFVGAYLQGARLSVANLQKACLENAHLQGANLWSANLQEADLRGTNLQGADLTRANLSKARLLGVKISQETRLEGVNWGPKYILREEENRQLEEAVKLYRMLKQWHTNAGIYDIAGKFFYREMEVQRNARRWRKRPHLKLWSWAKRLLCGYGEEPIRVVGWAVAVVLGMAGIYSASALTFGSSLYYSAVSFTALGYGLWVPTPEGWVKWLGAFEAFIGVFMMALFLVTFVRKMVR